MAARKRGVHGGNSLPVALEHIGGVPVVNGSLTINDGWSPLIYPDEGINDSDKSFIIPPQKEWQILSVWVELTTSADVGDRQLEIQIQDTDSDIVAQLQTGLVQAASLTYNYLFAPGLPDLTSIRDTNYLLTPIPPTFIYPSGFTIRIWDNNAVAAAADDMVIQLHVAERTA